MSTLGLIVYGLLGLVLARLVAGNQAYEIKSRYDTAPKTEDWVFGCTVGFLAGALWPLVVVAKLILLVPIRGQAETRARQRQHDQELREREEKVARLERDLGIGR